MSNKINNKSRRLLTASMSLALLISLSSCSGATNTTGNLNSKEVYAKAGNYEVTTGELWNELQWSASSVLDSQITNVVLNSYTSNIATVMDKKFADLTTEEKEKLDITEESEFNNLYEKYSARLADYVVQDIYNLNFNVENYWDGVEDLSEVTKKVSIQQYVDSIYVQYHKLATDGGDKYLDLIAASSESNIEGYIAIANDLRQLYYPLLAKELLTYDKLYEKIEEALEEDEDDDDNKYGYFTNSQYQGKFNNLYSNQYDLNMIMIRFATETEFNDTLRAFGLKIYNNRFYFIKDSADGSKLSYKEYIKHYDEFKTSELEKEYGVEPLYGQALLEIYVQIYNYIYGGYRTTLKSNFNEAFDDINNLRAITNKIVNAYASNADAQYESSINLLNENNATETYYTVDDLEDFSASFKTYLYETLELSSSYDSCYSTATQSANGGYYIVYKFDEQKEKLDELAAKYQAYYEEDHTAYETLEFILDSENADLYDEVLYELIKDEMSDSKISSYLSEEIENATVKIYNEATEITYSTSNTEYSKTLKKNKNKNVLATIEYEGKTWNLNISADENDKNSVCLPGTTTPVGVYNLLEATNGTTTAIDLISEKVIKNTQTYKDLLKDKEKIEYFEAYLESMLVSFTSDYYASSGYSSEIGKYNFLMLYFHTADVEEIINEYYMVQYASTSLLTDYSSEDLAKFMQKYTDLSYEDYFSLSGSRMVVYMDMDDDGEADDIDLEDSNSWIYKEVQFEGNTVTLEQVAKNLVYEIYNKISASNDSHDSVLASIVAEINASARTEYEGNIVAAENIWAKYRHLGLNVKTEDFATTNADKEIDFALKQRLYDYARGYSEDADGNKTATYQYYIGQTVPTIYIEPLTDAAISTSNDTIITTKDGFNLILVKSGEAKPTAEWTQEDNNEDLLTNITLKYNEEYYVIDNIYNNGINETNADLNGALNLNQIRLYLLDNAVNGASTLMPGTVSSSVSTFLEPVYSRYTSAETQRIILLSFVKVLTNQESNVSLNGVIEFANADYNGNDGYFANIIKINQNTVDSYGYLYEDTTGTSDLYPDWWEEIEAQVASFLMNVKEVA